FTFPITYYKCTKDVEICKNQCGSDSACSLRCSNSKNCTAVNDPNAGKIGEELDLSQNNKDSTDSTKTSSYVNRDYLFSSSTLLSSNLWALYLSILLISLLTLDS
ncbi:hypothetical protein BB561_005508, partial [Smittium simulii]